MADLQFVDFALMLGPVRKEKQFGLPGDFYNIDVTILSWMSYPMSGFPTVFDSMDRPPFGDSQTVSHDECKANLNISALRGRNRRLLDAVM